MDSIGDQYGEFGDVGGSFIVLITIMQFIYIILQSWVFRPIVTTYSGLS